MKRTFSTLTGAAALLLGASAVAQGPAPTCDDLVWSAQLLAANPDIAQSCQGVYVRNDELFAKVTIELVRVRGNRLTFRPRHVDGSLGTARSINVDSSFRIDIDGRQYRASELLPGQELSVYVPEDRFALAVDDGAFDGNESFIMIEDAEIVSMPDK